MVGGVGFVPPPPLLSGVTVTVAVWLAVPPAPVQVSVKSVVSFNAPVLAVPLVAWLPLHEPPLEVQEDASVLDQVSVLLPPAVTEVGFADRLTVGAGEGSEQLLPLSIGVQLVSVVSKRLSSFTLGELPISLNVYCPAARLALMTDEGVFCQFTHVQVSAATADPPTA